jgi:tight adherence protein B
VTALAPALLALAGLFAERASTRAVRARAEKTLGLPERRSERRPIPLRALAPIAAALGLLAWAGPVAAACGAVIVAAGVVVHSRRRLAAVRRGREEQLPEAVAAIAGGIRAGLSLTQAIAHARDETIAPLRDDLARLVDRVDMGTPVAEALAGWADDLDSEDARLIAGVLDLHRQSGGDLPAVLDGLVGTLRERRAAHDEVRALTAQARLSGTILGMLPIGFFGFLLLTSRDEMMSAIATPLGGTAVAAGLVMECVAFLWIRRLLVVR